MSWMWEIICARALPILFLSIQINIFKRVGVSICLSALLFFFPSSSSFSIASTLNQIQSYRIKLHIQIDFFLLHCFIPFWLFIYSNNKNTQIGQILKPSRKNNNNNDNIAGKAAATTIYGLRRFYIYRFVSLSLSLPPFDVFFVCFTLF